MLAGLAACGPRETKEPPFRPPAQASVAERVKVLNADVFVIDGRHIRLADAVAPQPIPDARCWAEALAAKQATAAARELVRSADDLRVEPTGARDEYNREIAHVVLDNQDLGRTLHDMGIVADTSSGRFGWCDPISAGGEGAPDVHSLLDFSPG
jgi:hypothetical protein